MTNQLITFYEEGPVGPCRNIEHSCRKIDFLCYFLYLIPTGLQTFTRWAETMLTDINQPC